MKLTFLTALLLTSLTALHAAAPDLSKVTSRADLDAVLAATADATLKQSLTEHAAAILAAAEQHPHVEAVIRTIESAPGTFVKINTTPEALKTVVDPNTGHGQITLRFGLPETATNIQYGGDIDQGKVRHWQVTIKVGFTVDG